jgi:C1A family cysteine protease
MFKYIKSLFSRLFSKAKVNPSLAGWIPDISDIKDYIYEQVTKQETRGLAQTSVNLTGLFGPVESQGNLNSCVGHAATSLFEVVTKTSDRSRLAVYYNARVLEGRAGVDSGCQIRNAMKGLSMNGAADESTWPYVASQVLVKPSATAVQSGLATRTLVSYARVTTLDGLKASLAAGRPVAFGFSVPESFRTITATQGHLPFPAAGEKFIGGHAVVAVGYDDMLGTVLCRNSFGPLWGKVGYFTMPYAWFANMSGLVTDAWTIIPKV